MSDVLDFHLDDLVPATPARRSTPRPGPRGVVLAATTAVIRLVIV